MAVLGVSYELVFPFVHDFLHMMILPNCFVVNWLDIHHPGFATGHDMVLGEVMPSTAGEALLYSK